MQKKELTTTVLSEVNREWYKAPNFPHTSTAGGETETRRIPNGLQNTDALARGLNFARHP